MVFVDLAGKAWWIDGRNRLDCLALLGIHPVLRKPRRGTPEAVFLVDRDDVLRGVEWAGYLFGDDPWAYVYSKNLLRRHLTDEDRREKIAEYVCRYPNKSDRQIGRELGRDHKTIGKVRAEQKDVGSIPHIETRTDKHGRRRPAHQPPKPKPQPIIPVEARKAQHEAEKEQLDRVCAAADFGAAEDAQPAPEPEPPPAEPLTPARSREPKGGGGYDSSGANEQLLLISLERVASQLAYVANNSSATTAVSTITDDARLRLQFAKVPSNWLIEFAGALAEAQREHIPVAPPGNQLGNGQ
jgi:hypothetical protein